MTVEPSDSYLTIMSISLQLRALERKITGAPHWPNSARSEGLRASFNWLWFETPSSRPSLAATTAQNKVSIERYSNSSGARTFRMGLHSIQWAAQFAGRVGVS